MRTLWPIFYVTFQYPQNIKKAFCNARLPENGGITFQSLFRGYSIAKGTNNIFWCLTKWRERKMFLIKKNLNSFCANIQFLYASKTSENLFWFFFGIKYFSFASDVETFMGYVNETLAWNGSPLPSRHLNVQS